MLHIHLPLEDVVEEVLVEESHFAEEMLQFV